MSDEEKRGSQTSRAPSVARFSRLMYLWHSCRSTWMNSLSYSWPVYLAAGTSGDAESTAERQERLRAHHAPPVISRLGSSSNSMYTLRLLLATLLTALISLRCSSDLRHLLICGERQRQHRRHSASKRVRARLRLLQVAANLEVFRPKSCGGEASVQPPQPYSAAGARRTHVARLLDKLEDQHLVMRQAFEPGAECGRQQPRWREKARQRVKRVRRTSQAPPA